MITFLRENHLEMREMEELISAVNFDLMVYTIKVQKRLEDNEFEGNPWHLFKLGEIDLVPFLDGIPTVHDRLKSLPLVNVRPLEREGVETPHIFASYLENESWRDEVLRTDLRERLEELVKILAFYIK